MTPGRSMKLNLFPASLAPMIWPLMRIGGRHRGRLLRDISLSGLAINWGVEPLSKM